MEQNREKMKRALSRCIVELMRREGREGLRQDRPDGLIRDYHDTSFDDDPLAQEYRQLQKTLGIRRKKAGDGDPDGAPQRVRRKSSYKPPEL